MSWNYEQYDSKVVLEIDVEKINWSVSGRAEICFDPIAGDRLKLHWWVVLTSTDGGHHDMGRNPERCAVSVHASSDSKHDSLASAKAEAEKAMADAIHLLTAKMQAALIALGLDVFEPPEDVLSEFGPAATKLLWPGAQQGGAS